MDLLVRASLHSLFLGRELAPRLQDPFSSEWTRDGTQKGRLSQYIENDCDQPQERSDVIFQLYSTSDNPYATLDELYWPLQEKTYQYSLNYYPIIDCPPTCVLMKALSNQLVLWKTSCFLNAGRSYSSWLCWISSLLYDSSHHKTISL